MTSRLQAAGVRPISPIVDITNYVLIELGHPMHAFDLATLAGRELRIRVRRPGETHDDARRLRRTLDPEMLVIADRDSRAGGGRASWAARRRRSRAPRRVVFESAYFKPASVRRTSKRLGLKTEASSRFERGADINAPGRRAATRPGADGADRRGRAVGPIVDRYPVAAGPDASACGARGWRAARARGPGRRGRADPARRSGLAVAPAADGWDVVGAHVPRGSPARSRPHRGSRPALRLRQARADVPADDAAGAAARPAHPARSAGARGC